jgi:hypothetical protein
MLEGANLIAFHLVMIALQKLDMGEILLMALLEFKQFFD